MRAGEKVPLAAVMGVGGGGRKWWRLEGGWGGGMEVKGRGWKGTGAGMAAGAGCLGTAARM